MSISPLPLCALLCAQFFDAIARLKLQRSSGHEQMPGNEAGSRDQQCPKPCIGSSDEKNRSPGRVTDNRNAGIVAKPKFEDQGVLALNIFARNMRS
jgi:hypothetical protein